jgi:hypothetical protein
MQKQGSLGKRWSRWGTLVRRIQFGFPQDTRTKGDDFVARDNNCFARARITSRARFFLADGKLAKASDQDVSGWGRRLGGRGREVDN